MKSPSDITPDALRTAYDESGLAQLGISFESAAADHALHTSLVGMVRSARERADQAAIHYTGSRLAHPVEGL